MAQIPGQPCRCRTGLSLTHEAIPNSSSEVLQAQRELACGPDSYSKERQIFVVALYRAGLPLTGHSFRVHLPSVTVTSDSSLSGWGGYTVRQSGVGGFGTIWRSSPT